MPERAILETLLRPPGVFVVLVVAIASGVISRWHVSRTPDRELGSTSGAPRREWAYDALAFVHILSVSILAGSLILYFFPNIGR